VDVSNNVRSVLLPQLPAGFWLDESQLRPSVIGVEDAKDKGVKKSEMVKITTMIIIAHLSVWFLNIPNPPLINRNEVFII